MTDEEERFGQGKGGYIVYAFFWYVINGLRNQINNIIVGSGDAWDYAITPANTNYQTLSGALNGSNKVFTVPNGKYTSGKIVVFLNGGMQSNFVQTSPSTGVFTMGFAPNGFDELFVMYVIN